MWITRGISVRSEHSYPTFLQFLFWLSFFFSFFCQKKNYCMFGTLECLSLFKRCFDQMNLWSWICTDINCSDMLSFFTVALMDIKGSSLIISCTCWANSGVLMMFNCFLCFCVLQCFQFTSDFMYKWCCWESSISLSRYDSRT